MKQQPERQCDYWRMVGRFFNAGGARPCQSCPSCERAHESMERLKKWNRDTANGADPRR